ncbi:hypothetical protein GCM10023084_38710 [Streptomyces lacrimifluminis]|uniref:Uncharacterized protein n=1 Tax=Streptomyces lacrimifluminis TaxID=1500077 RepID=A0A917L0U4_9ACTN|nr:hypothetical protein GCM10012282_40330 [Streptomyces lacrimifluminis]
MKMNRVEMGLAVGAGYVLGRTKKLKLVFAVGAVIAAKRMQLSPQAVADLLSGQLRDNPQFKEIVDRLREDLRDLGKADRTEEVGNRPAFKEDGE